MVAWLSKACRWIAAAVVALPALAALYLWGSRWRERARSAEAARVAAWAAANAATERANRERARRKVEAAARTALRAKLDARLSAIRDLEARAGAAKEGADRINEVFVLGDVVRVEDVDGPGLGEGSE